MEKFNIPPNGKHALSRSSFPHLIALAVQENKVPVVVQGYSSDFNPSECR